MAWPITQSFAFLWPPYGIEQAIIFSSCRLFYLSSSFFPRLISAVADWMSAILPHISANLGCRCETCCTRLAQNTGRKKSPSGHHRTTLSGYIFATKVRIDNRKKNFLNSNTSPTIWWTSAHQRLRSAHFNGFCVLAALLHGTLVLGVSQTLRRWTEGATYIWQGGHNVGHWHVQSVAAEIRRGKKRKIEEERNHSAKI